MAVGAVGFILIMVGRTGFDLAVYATSFLLDLILAVVLVPRLGTEGAAVAQTTTIALSNAVRMYLVWRFVGIQPFNRHYLRLAVPAIVCFAGMIAGSLVLRDARPAVLLLGTALVGAIAYVPVLLRFGLTPTEKRTIRHLIGRGDGESLAIRPVAPADEEWVRNLMSERWAGEEQVVNGEVFRPTELPGFVATEEGGRVGLLTYRIDGEMCVLGTLDSLDEGRGIGTALVNTAREEAERAGCTRMRVVTTNDNRHALGFYRSMGFQVTAVREGAVVESRKLKPSIPLVGEDGIPITDEIELELTLA